MQTKILASNKPEIADILDDVDDWQRGIIYNLWSWLESFRGTASLKNKLIWTICFLIISLVSTITLNQYDYNFFLIILIASIILTVALIPYKFLLIRKHLMTYCLLAVLICIFCYLSNTNMQDDKFASHIRAAYNNFVRNNFIREYFKNIGIGFLTVLFILGTGLIGIFLYPKNKTFSRFCNFFQAYIMSFIHVYLFTAAITYGILFLAVFLGIMNHDSLLSNIILFIMFTLGIPFFVRKEAEDKIKRSMKLFEHKWTYYNSTRSSLVTILQCICASVIIVTLNSRLEYFKEIVIQPEKFTTEEIQLFNIGMLFCIAIIFLTHLLMSEYSIDKKYIAKTSPNV